MRRHYRYGSVVVAASGSVSHNRLVKLTREKFAFGEGKAEPAPPARRADPGRVIVRHEDSSQTHFCLGFPGLAYNDRKKMAMLVLITHLGGGMSSVLFQKLREQRGLAYSVYAYHDFCRDTGIFGVYLGTDATRLRESYDLVDAECRRLKKRELSSVALDQAKAQLKGHLTLSMESTSNRMHRLGRQELMSGDYLATDQALRQIDRVTAGDILSLANQVFETSQISIAAQGPVDANIFEDVV
jgi:predicted Zn-dependent peptidase